MRKIMNLILVAFVSVWIVSGCKSSSGVQRVENGLNEEAVAGKVVYREVKEPDQEKSVQVTEIDPEKFQRMVFEEEGVLLVQYSYERDDCYGSWTVEDGSLRLDGCGVDTEGTYTLLEVNDTAVRVESQSGEETWYLQQRFAEEELKGKGFVSWRDSDHDYYFYTDENKMLVEVYEEIDYGDGEIEEDVQADEYYYRIDENGTLHVCWVETPENCHRIYKVGQVDIGGNDDMLLIWSEQGDYYFFKGGDGWQR